MIFVDDCSGLLEKYPNAPDGESSPGSYDLPIISSMALKMIFLLITSKRYYDLFLFQTRIFVTHAVQYLAHVDQIIVLQDGVVSEVRLVLYFRSQS